ncbi:MAG: preprotein translocase subunit SecY [Proteobacteria bacterium]|nr:preprotein translocase subunit SecY [Pseudomonadota bacterium]
MSSLARHLRSKSTTHSLPTFKRDNEGFGIFSKVLFVFFMLIIYRFGTYIPIPKIDVVALSNFNSDSRSVFGMFNMLTGGALGRVSIFSLNIIPYITASIIMQLLMVASEDLKNLKKEGSGGRRKIQKYTKLLMIIISIIQGYGMISGMESMLPSEAIVGSKMEFRLIGSLVLLGGAFVVLYLSEKITESGLGNGSSIIIFTGIVSGLPSAITALFEMGRVGSINVSVIVMIISMMLLLIYGIVFIEKGQRKLQIQYPKRQIGNKLYAANSSNLPLKVNTAGVIPAIFAGSLLMIPTTIANLLNSDSLSDLKRVILFYFSHGTFLYIACYFLLICFFCFFYTSIAFNADEVSENLRKNGAIIPGIRPGKQTALHIDFVLFRITVLSAFYMGIVCVIPEIFISRYSIPFYLGGTSLLIVINVVMDVFSKMQTYFMTMRYHDSLKKNKVIINPI